MKKPILAALFGVAMLTPLAACDSDGPAEEAGEEIDEAADDVEEEVED